MLKLIELYKNRAFKEFTAVAVLTLLFLGVSAKLDLFGWLVAFATYNEGWHIPAVFVATFFAAIGLGAFSLRRWLEQEGLNVRLVKVCGELEQQKSEMQLLSEMTDLLQSCLTVEEASRIVAKFVQQGLPGFSGGLYLMQKSRSVLEPCAVWGDGIAGEGTFAPRDCWALRRGLPRYSEGSAEGLRCGHLDERMTGPTVCAPMMAHCETVGMLHLFYNRPETSLPGGAGEVDSNRVEKLAVRFATAAGLALANLKLRETLRSQSVRDPLTGLFNRRYLEELLNIEMGRAIRKLRPLAIVMVDADHFKQFNDRFGHEAGDNVLRNLGAVLAKVVRKEDLACRYGGEEFVLVLPEATQEIACVRADRMREEVRKLIVNHDGQGVGPITISAGVAAFPNHGATAETLLKAADAALYQAKAQGRDRVALARTPETSSAEGSNPPTYKPATEPPASPAAPLSSPLPGPPVPASHAAPPKPSGGIVESA